MSTTPPPPPKTSTFTLFPSLPKELRYKIYTHTLTLTPPRLIDTHTTLFPDPDYDSDLDSPDIARDGSLKLTIKCYHIPHQFISLQSLPHALLHVSSESRAFVLERYERSIETSDLGRKWFRFPRSCQHLSSVKANKRERYIDNKRDILFFHWYHGNDSDTEMGKRKRDSFEIEEKNMVYMGLLDRCVVKCGENVAVDGKCFVGWVAGEMEIADLSRTRMLVVVRGSPCALDVDGDGGGEEGGVGQEDEYPLYKDKEWRIGADVLRREERRGVDVGGVLEGILRKKIRREFEPKKGFQIGVVERMEDVVGFVERFGRRWSSSRSV